MTGGEKITALCKLVEADAAAIAAGAAKPNFVPVFRLDEAGKAHITALGGSQFALCSATTGRTAPATAVPCAVCMSKATAILAAQ